VPSTPPAEPSAVERPTGRDEVRAAVLDAAARRFAREGRKASLRDIADDANVNLGLIHRHFGNKDDLLREVLRTQTHRGIRVIEEAADAGDALRRVFEGATHDGLYIRIIAWLLLEEPGRVQYQDDFPGMALLRALDRAATSDAEDTGDVDRDARLMAAMATIYGWSVFGPQLLASFGYPDDARTELESRLASLLTRIARGDDAARDEA
jgi:AcrR family transcriptional regulator